ncbi:MAG: SDR family oxidoreductase [Thermonemataceae bacterium]
MSKRIVVTGATGNIGSFATKQLLALGHKVRTVVRSQVKADKLKEAGAEAVLANLNDSIRPALFEDTDAALLINPSC